MPESIDVYSMPFDVNGSPYFKAWRSALARLPEPIEVEPVPKGGVFALFLRRPWRSRRRILCVHWSTELYGSKYALRSLWRLAVNIPVLLILKACFGLRVVWVLHNNYAHDYPHPAIDRLGRRCTAMIADAIVAQQASTAERLRKAYPKKRIAYVPHSNDIGAYGPLVRDKNAMRTRFGFAEGDIVCLVLGSVRPYKKIEKIIEAFQMQSEHERSRLQLWIVGMGNPKPYFEGLERMAAGSPQIRMENTFVPDDEIPAYAACADYSVAFFDDSELTSGSVVLSLSYGLPAIVRDIPGAERVENGVNGFLFEDVLGLRDIFAKLPEHPIPSQDAVAASIAADTWDSAAAKYSVLWNALV